MNNGEHYTDDEIIGKILAGEVALFEILIRRNNSYLYKVGRSYKYTHEDTEDLMQETFIDAYMNLSSFRHHASFKTWIIRIMLNNCYKKQQRYGFKNEVAEAITDTAEPMYASRHGTDTTQTVINRELSNVIENGLSRVPLAYRMVFSLREISGLSVSETATALDISEVNVKVRLNRAKALLRKEIEKTYSAEDIFEFNLIYCDMMVKRVMNTLQIMSSLNENAGRLAATD